MKNNIQKIYDQANFFLDNDVNYQNCKIDYILENPKNGDVLLLASDGYEVAIEFQLKDGKLDYYKVPEWDYNFDYYLYNRFEEGYKIACMTDEVHYNLWNSIHDLYPTDIFCICYDYVFGGCKSRRDYEYMVNFLFEQEDIREELLK